MFTTTREQKNQKRKQKRKQIKPLQGNGKQRKNSGRKSLSKQNQNFSPQAKYIGNI